MKEGAKAVHKIEELARIAVDCGLQVHKELGPGLLESVYETLLAAKFEKRGLRVERQKVLPIDLPDLKLDAAYRVDLLVDECLIIEVKALERLAPIHTAQLLTYLRLSKQPVGLLMNFGGDIPTGAETCRKQRDRSTMTPRAFFSPSPLRDQTAFSAS